MIKKVFVLAVASCSPAIFALATIAAPHIALLLLGLAFLGVIDGVVTLIGILLAVGGAMRVFSAGPAGLADQLMA